ncbi:MAG: alpha/beta hydrolase [Rhodobacterales bacterium]|nr:alpha/beta hydrolase [Rhodobacterales bacterium]
MNARFIQPAPFYADVADAPEGGQIYWAQTSDGLRLRLAHWAEGDRGTVFLFPGRTEYVEKYGPSVREFAARGFATLIVDWRGQGLADRMIDDPLGGHVVHFADYQKDVAAMLAAAGRLNLPRPYYLVAHSMGGAIGLRALHEGLPVQAAVFSAPMWGIVMAPVLRPIAWSLSWASRGVGLDHCIAPGTSRASYLATTSFDENMLTTDPEIWAWMQSQIAAHPDLALGGPSLRWLSEALRETHALTRRPAPVTPTYVAVGSAEQIVDAGKIARLMAQWPQGRLEVIEGARHEMMMETPPIRKHFFDTSCALFARHR